MKSSKYILGVIFSLLVATSAMSQVEGSHNAIKTTLVPNILQGCPNLSYEHSFATRKSFEVSVGTSIDNEELLDLDITYGKIGLKYVVPLSNRARINANDAYLISGFFMEPEFNYVYRSLGGKKGIADETFTSAEEYLNKIEEHNYAFIVNVGFQVCAQFIMFEMYAGLGYNYSPNAMLSSTKYLAFKKNKYCRELGIKIGFMF